MTTSRKPASWYLDGQTARRPDPRLRGELGPAGISVVRFADAGGRNSFLPHLCVRPEPATGDGTTLTGTIGMTPDGRAAMLIVTGGAGLIAAGMIAGGLASLAAGHLSGLVVALLVPFTLTAIIAGVSAAGLRSLEARIPGLIGEMNEILGSVATFPAS